MPAEVSIRPQGGTGRHFWWSRPSRLVLFALVPIYLYCGYMDEVFYSLYAHRAKYLTGDSFIVGLIALLAFALGAALMERPTQPSETMWASPARTRTALIALYVLVFAAYAVFFFPLLLRPQIILEHLRGSPETMSELRLTLNRIPGITSFVALQSLCVVLSLSYERLTGERLPKFYRIAMIAVVAACILRAWLWSERLALVELIVPAAVAKYALISERDGIRRRLLNIAPLAGVVVIFAVFAFGEYFRSWQYYKDYLPYSFLEFSWTRFLGYYATALANGAHVYALHEPDYMPMMTASWFYKIPLWTWFEVPMSTDSDYSRFLEVYLNPEFNNLSGVFMPLRDFGAAAGILCWVAVGGLSGALFRSFAGGRVLGLMLYPVWFVGIAELLRIFYWGETRFTPVVLASLALAFYLGTDMRKVRRRVFGVAAAHGLLALFLWGGLIDPAAASDTGAPPACASRLEQDGRPAVDVRAFGARGDGTSDDGPAIQAALDSLQHGGVALLAPGTYAHSQVIRLRHKGLILAGNEAVLLASDPYRAAIVVEGDAASVRDLTIKSVPHERRGDRIEHAGLVLQGAGSSALNNTVEGFIGAGIFVNGARQFTVGCNRVLRTKADGIHVTEGALGGQIAHNAIFNSEDDGIGLVSYDARKQVSGVVVEHNRIEHIPWGRGISVIGSTRITIRGNTVHTIAVAAGILVAREEAWHTPGASDVLIEGNDIRDIQQSLAPLGNMARTGHGAIELNSDRRDPALSVSKVTVVGNTIRGAAYDGVRLLGNVCDAAIERNDISEVAGRAIVVTRPTCPVPIARCEANRRDGRPAECVRLGW